MGRLALLLPALAAAAEAASPASAAEDCGGPVFGGALDLGGHLAVVLRFVESKWLALRGTAGFEVMHGGRWPVSTARGVSNPSGSNVINLAPVPGYEASGVPITHYTNSTALVLAAVAVGAVQGRVLYSSSTEERHSLPTALTFGGIHTSVVVDCAAVADLCSRRLEGHLPTIHDCRGKWPDAQAATAYAIDHLLSKTASDDMMVFLDPSVLASGLRGIWLISSWPGASSRCFQSTLTSHHTSV